MGGGNKMDKYIPDNILDTIKQKYYQCLRSIYDFIKYCDIFGTKFSFYTDEKPKLYSVLGGIFTFALITT